MEEKKFIKFLNEILHPKMKPFVGVMAGVALILVLIVFCLSIVENKLPWVSEQEIIDLISLIFLGLFITILAFYALIKRSAVAIGLCMILFIPILIRYVREWKVNENLKEIFADTNQIAKTDTVYLGPEDIEPITGSLPDILPEEDYNLAKESIITVSLLIPYKFRRSSNQLEVLVDNNKVDVLESNLLEITIEVLAGSHEIQLTDQKDVCWVNRSFKKDKEQVSGFKCL